MRAFIPKTVLVVSVTLIASIALAAETTQPAEQKKADAKGVARAVKYFEPIATDLKKVPDLTDEQRATADKVLAEAAQAYADFAANTESGAAGQPARKRKLNESMKAARQAVAALLTDAQKPAFK